MVEFLFHDDASAGGLARLHDTTPVQWTAVHSAGHWFIVMHDDPERADPETRRCLLNIIANALSFPAELRDRLSRSDEPSRRHPRGRSRRLGPVFQVAS